MKKGLWIIVILLTAAIVYLVNENRKLKNEISGHKELFMLLQREMQYKDQLLSLADSSVISKAPSDYLAPVPGKTLKIKGEFLGWNGNTVFELDDGSIWQQAIHDVFFFKAVNPEVTILKKNGSFSLQVKGTDRSVRVNQIR